MAPKRKFTLVYIRWRDASYERGEKTIDELKPLIDIESGGILIREDDESISIALDYYADDGTWRHISHIPKINIRRIKRVTLVL